VGSFFDFALYFGCGFSCLLLVWGRRGRWDVLFGGLFLVVDAINYERWVAWVYWSRCVC